MRAGASTAESNAPRGAGGRGGSVRGVKAAVPADAIAAVQPAFLARCRELAASPADADDLAQEVYLRLLLSPARDPAKLLRWLRSTARNVMLQRWRLESREDFFGKAVSFDAVDGGDWFVARSGSEDWFPEAAPQVRRTPEADVD